MSFPRLPLKYLMLGIAALVLITEFAGSQANADVILVMWVLGFYAALAGWVRQDTDRENREQARSHKSDYRIEEFFDEDRYEHQQTDTYPMEY